LVLRAVGVTRSQNSSVIGFLSFIMSFFLSLRSHVLLYIATLSTTILALHPVILEDAKEKSISCNCVGRKYSSSRKAAVFYLQGVMRPTRDYDFIWTAWLEAPYRAMYHLNALNVFFGKVENYSASSKFKEKLSDESESERQTNK